MPLGIFIGDPLEIRHYREQDAVMNFQHVIAFYVVARERSFSTAARRLHFAQSTITDQVKSLERDLGVALFRRRGSRAVELTHEGRRLIPYAEKLISTEADARRVVTDLNEPWPCAARQAQ